MKKGHLSDYFETVAAKRLSAVEADAFRSNQHEFNGVAAFKSIFGQEKRSFAGTFIYLSDGQDDVISDTSNLTWYSDTGNLTWYDARENHPTRTEYRLYYPSATVFDHVTEGDLLLLCKINENDVMIILAEQWSTVENQLCWLFDLDSEQLSTKVDSKAIVKSDATSLVFTHNLILELLGIDVTENVVDNSCLDDLLKAFPSGFPTTKNFSSFARDHLGPAEDDPDTLLLSWMEHEEVLFRTLERHLLQHRLDEAFIDVDTFISYSLSVHNRRKSRAGYAFENHLEALFQQYDIPYSRNKVTELKAKPDFIFPSVIAYHDNTFPTDQLFMLAVKTSCKDRWRQILPEAARILSKHLITLEPGISTDQTDEMQANNVQLVIPKAIQNTYRKRQIDYIVSVENFVTLMSSTYNHD